jgi:hypothetical protein
MQILYILEPCRVPKDNATYSRQTSIIHARLDDELKYLVNEGHIDKPTIIYSDDVGFPIGNPTIDVPFYRIDLTVTDLEKKIGEMQILSKNWHKYTRELRELFHTPKPANCKARYSELDPQLVDENEFNNMVSEYQRLLREGQRFFGTKDVLKWADELNRLVLPDGMESNGKHKIYDEAIAAIKTSSYWLARAEVKKASFVDKLKEIVLLNTLGISDK